MIDVIEVLYRWVNCGPYYGETAEVESAIGEQLRKTSTGLLEERYGDVYYGGTEDRNIAWLDIDLAFRQLSAEDRYDLFSYLDCNKEKPREDWSAPEFGLWLRIYAILETLLQEIEDGI